MKTTRMSIAVLAATLGLSTLQARADITIGVSQPLTGTTSDLGLLTKSGFALWPTTIAGEKIKFIFVDDAGDPARAAKIAHHFIHDDKVDLIIGSSATPASLAISGIAAEGETVQLSTSPIELPPQKDDWTFRLPQSTAVMAKGIIKQMKRFNIKSLAYLGYADPYGDSWLREITTDAHNMQIRISDVERFNRTDSSVSEQAKKIISSKPDAVLIVALGGAAAMPQKALIELGYQGKLFQTHSAASHDFIKAGGKNVEGDYCVAGLALLPEGLPDNHPSKQLAVDFVQRYEKQFGPGSRNQFAAHAYDAQLILQKIVPEALKMAKPGTAEFRLALKQALENSGNINITQGVMHYSATDHFGLGSESRMMMTIKNGEWKAIPE